MVWHEKISSLYIGIYELKTITHLRVGSGEAIKLPTPIDNPQTRILRLEPGKLEGEWYVYIPASSLHGVIRSSLETYLRTTSPSPKSFGEILNEIQAQELKKARGKLSVTLLDNVDSLPLYPATCYTTFEFDKCEIPLRKEQENWKEKYFESIGRYRLKDGKHQPYMCYVCQTFGAAGFRGRVRILSAYPSEKTIEKLPLEIITRTAIDRVTGAVTPGALFDLEAVPPGTQFYFAVIIENAFEEVTYLKGFDKNNLISVINENASTVNYLDLFKKGVRMISKGIVNIGAHGTIGFGYVSLKEKCSLSIFSNEIRDFVKMFLEEKNEKERFKAIYDKFKNKLSKDEEGELDIKEEFYPEIIRLLIKYYRGK